MDKALEAMDRLTEGGRLAGIICHEDRLGRSIPRKIRVHTGERPTGAY